jgi:hypothetical protein
LRYPSGGNRRRNHHKNKPFHGISLLRVVRASGLARRYIFLDLNVCADNIDETARRHGRRRACDKCFGGKLRGLLRSGCPVAREWRMALSRPAPRNWRPCVYLVKIGGGMYGSFSKFDVLRKPL